MVSILYEGRRISPRLKDALVSDLVHDNLDEEADSWLTIPLGDEFDWTYHLGRQLGVAVRGVPGVHDTLLMVVLELDALLRTWPIPHDQRRCLELSRQVTKHLVPFEMAAMLLAGQRWRNKGIEACTVGNLAGVIRPVLERALAAELHRMLGQWVDRNIPRLRERRKQAKARLEAAQREAPPSDPTGSLHRPTAQERLDRSKERSSFRPPGRT